MRLVAASILADTNLIGEIQVELTWETPLISRHDWKALSLALQNRDIPKQISVETRTYATVEIAEHAIAALGGKLVAA